MPAVRPYWKGYIKLALVSCPIALYTALLSKGCVAFHQVNKKTGNRLRQELVDEVTREPIEAEDSARGYEYAKNQYVIVDEAELEAIEIESTHTIEIDSFVPRSEIDERYLENPYYIAPNQPIGQEAFAVIREAMRGRLMIALGRVVLAKRERVIMLQPWDNGIMGTTLRYPYEVRDAKDYFSDIPEITIEKELQSLAEHILKAKEAHFDPSKFVDHYEETVVAMLKKKQEGLPATKAKVPRPNNIVNLFDALRQSIAEEEKSAPKPTKTAKPERTKKGKAPVEGQRELLLPIAGKKTEAERKPTQAQAPGRRKAG